MIVLKILIFILPLIILAEGQFKIGPFHRSTPDPNQWEAPIISRDLPAGKQEQKSTPSFKSPRLPSPIVSEEKSTSEAPTTFSPKLDKEVPKEIQTPKPTQPSLDLALVSSENDKKLPDENQEPKKPDLSQSVNTNNIYQGTRLFYAPKPASSPWSPPTSTRLPSKALQSASRPILVQSANHNDQPEPAIPTTTTDTSVTEAPNNLKLVISTDSPKEIQTTKPLDIITHQNPIVPKPASTPWMPPQIPSIDPRSKFQPGFNRPASYYKPITTSNGRNIPELSSSDRKKFSTDPLKDIDTPKLTPSHSLHTIQVDNRHLGTNYFIPRPASSPWEPRKIGFNSSLPVHVNKGSRMESGPYVRPHRSADSWDREISIPQPEETTAHLASTVSRFKCPQAFGYYSYTGECNEYIECKNYVPLAYTCPAGFHFNPVVEWTEYPCDDPSKVICDKESTHFVAAPAISTASVEEVITPRPISQKSDYICPQQHGYFKFTDECGEYVECKNYIPRMFTCPIGLHFNPLVEWTAYPCDHPLLVQCDREPDNNTPQPTLPPTTRPPPPTTTITTRKPLPPPTTARPPPPPPRTTWRPPITWRPPPPPTKLPPLTTSTTNIPLPPSTWRPPPPPPTTTWRPPPPPPTTTWRPPPPPPTTTRRPPPPPPTTWRPPPPPTKLPPLTTSTTRRPLPPPTTQPPPPPTTRPPPPPSTQPPPPPPTTTPQPIITPGPKNPPDYTIVCLQQHGYFKFSGSCGEYMECKNYVPLVFTCPVGLHFNPLASWTEYPCGHPSEVQCYEDGTVPPTTLPTPVVTTMSPVLTTSHPGSNVQDFKCPQAHGYFEHVQCSEYIECKNYVPLTYTCPDGLHFKTDVNWTDYPCDHPTKAQCDKDLKTKLPLKKPKIPFISDKSSEQFPILTYRPIEVTQQPQIVTSRPVEERQHLPVVSRPIGNIQRPPIVTFRPPQKVTMPPAVVVTHPTTVTPYVPYSPPQRNVEPPTDRPAIELNDFYCLKSNGYYSVDSKCDSYVECKNYIASQHFCPAGLYFNPKALWPNVPCDLLSRVHCSSNNDRNFRRPQLNIGTSQPVTPYAPHYSTQAIITPAVVTARPLFITSRPPVMTTYVPRLPVRPNATPAPISVAARPTAVTYVPRLPAQPTVKPPPLKQPYNYSCPDSNGFYSLVSHCDAYIECKDGKAIEHSCPDGLHFNSNTQWPDYPCGYPSEVKCSSGDVVQPPSPTSECPHRDGFFPTNSGDCGEYMVCHAGVAIVEHCPAGLVFNFEKDTCDWPVDVPDCNKARALDGFVCPATSVDVEELHIYKYRYGNSCKNFVACQDGQPRLLSCDAGLHYNEETESCIDSELVKDCEA